MNIRFPSRSVFLAVVCFPFLAPAGELPVVPAPKSWKPSGAVSAVDGKTWSYGDASLEPLVEVLRQELPGASFTRSASPSAGAVHLDMTGDGMATEAYQVEIGNSVVIRASSATGLFYGSRVLLQMFAAGGPLPAGKITDEPAYPVRSMLLDVGRKFAPVAELRDWIRMLAWYRFNELHLHLNDNSWGRYPGYRLESQAFPGITSKDGSYTWGEIRDLQDFARVRGITIVPEIDAPGHSLAFTAFDPTLAHPEIDREGFGLAYLDVRNPDAIRFMERLLDEVVPHFDSPQFHIGTDEYRINLIKDPAQRTECGELFRKWINHFARHLETKHGKTARIWSGYEHLPGSTEPDKSILIDMWETSDAKAKSAAGYRFINSSHFFTYIVPGAPYYGVNNRGIHQDWTPLVFANKAGAILAPGDPGILGGKLHIWNDYGPTGHTWNEIARLAHPSLQAFAGKLWGHAAAIPYDTFRERCGAVGASIPAVSLLKRRAAPDTGDVVWKLGSTTEFIANSSLVIDHPAGDLEWPWTASFTVLRKNDVKGDEVLIGSDLAAFYLDLSHEVKKKDVTETKRGVACVRANQAPGCDPLSSHNPDVLVFDYQVPVGRDVRLTFVGEERRTRLFADGKPVGDIAKQMVCPLGRIGAQERPVGFHGTLKTAELRSSAAASAVLGEWQPAGFDDGRMVFKANLPAGTARVDFHYLRGAHGVDIRDVELLRQDAAVHRFETPGFAGGRPKGNVFEVPAELRDQPGLSIRATLVGNGGTDSAGRVTAEPEM